MIPDGPPASGFECAFRKNLAHPDNVSTSFKMFSPIQKYAQTDLSLIDILKLMTFAKSIDLHSDVSVSLLPGSQEAGYWKPDYNEISRLITRLNPIDVK